MSDRIVVDPITRIEGHLRIEAQMDGDKIASAYSSGTMVRGIETILKGRDPREAWAFAQRICGVCTLVHGLASIRSVENALNYKIPKNADLIRNLMSGEIIIGEEDDTDREIAAAQNAMRKRMAQTRLAALEAQLEKLLEKEILLEVAADEDDDELITVKKRIENIVTRIDDTSHFISKAGQKRLKQSTTQLHLSEPLKIADFQLERKALPSNEDEQSKT
ncbi:Nickel-dependent hydrogenase, large subunit domain protein [Candidatus Thiomargarita nelsonii]|uniref:Uptake hydrogenase large subunit n=1 Tax=Candidatus Thiomargarita nelsonii TaxID=1003181 RepID=A0A0A6P1S7_9GAMM|nr:Nickel-dependent hydrogenase, large subunit domain protein [Candidatus Thiomargarita nelsonii]